MDYGAAAKCVDAFMDNIHWAHVATASIESRSRNDSIAPDGLPAFVRTPEIMAASVGELLADLPRPESLLALV
jgi:hypothetical protein